MKILNTTIWHIFKNQIIHLKLFLFVGLFFGGLAINNAQNTTCIGAEILCTPNAAFPAQTSAANLGALPSCGTAGQAPGFPVSPTLFSTPNPIFYTLQVEQSGDLYLFVDTFPAEDVDFAIWGPYSSTDAVANCAGGNFPPGAPIDCDYSTDPSEQIDVPGVLAGESYILMIANFSGNATDITLTPNNSHGTNTAVLGGPLAFSATQPGTLSTLNAAQNLEITPAASNPNVSGVSFSGPGITNTTNGTFDPLTAGIGVHTITVTGTSYLCLVTSTINITVTAPMPTLAIDDITADNILSTTEAGNVITITGTVGGDFNTGDMVTLIVRGNAYTGNIDALGAFSISVPGSELLADPDITVEGSVSVTDTLGNTGTANDAQPFSLDRDNDGIGDNVDLDDDNDGILDTDEEDCGNLDFNLPANNTSPNGLTFASIQGIDLTLDYIENAPAGSITEQSLSTSNGIGFTNNFTDSSSIP